MPEAAAEQYENTVVAHVRFNILVARLSIKFNFFLCEIVFSVLQIYSLDKFLFRCIFRPSFFIPLAGMVQICLLCFDVDFAIKFS